MTTHRVESLTERQGRIFACIPSFRFGPKSPHGRITGPPRPHMPGPALERDGRVRDLYATKGADLADEV
ncbi:hypothetical protein ACFV3F_01505 [Streptomyces sp. NPDC059717]|uniref:hypothetical protein n=1 Tax=Streptomyces sp. NPDC059717 TaxID=3346922 RepID=UPI0036B52D48